jgi:hypothetical protein
VKRPDSFLYKPVLTNKIAAGDSPFGVSKDYAPLVSAAGFLPQLRQDLFHSARHFPHAGSVDLD